MVKVKPSDPYQNGNQTFRKENGFIIVPEDEIINLVSDDEDEEKEEEAPQ